jgi:hypothetical protein
MKSFMLHITTIVAVLALAGTLPAATVTLKIEPTSSPTVPPNGAVLYRVLGRVVANECYGLATVGFDIETDTGRTQSPAVAGSAMAPFLDPDGLTNLAGFGGEAVDDDIRGIGGAQNTIDNDGVSPNPASPAGDVVADIGRNGWVEIATGQIAAPTQEATYTVTLANVFAGVLTAGSGPVWPVAEATVVLAPGSFAITVSSTAPQVFAGLDRDVFEGMGVALRATAVSALNQLLTNPLFAWQQWTGLPVTLAGADTADASFTAPVVNYVEDAALSFAVTASDGTGPASSDSINVRVYIAGDCSLDDMVDVVDNLMISEAMGYSLGDPEYNPLCDFNGDDTVDVVDLLIFVENFGRSLTSGGGEQLLSGGGLDGSSQMTVDSFSSSTMTSTLSSESTPQTVPTANGMTVYEALEYAGLLEMYLDYIGEHPEAARSW